MMKPKSMDTNIATNKFVEFCNQEQDGTNDFALMYDYCKQEFSKNYEAKKVSNMEDREDLFQDVMSYIVEHKKDFSWERVTNGRKTSFAAWVNCIISSKAIDFLRKGTMKDSNGNRVKKQYVDIYELGERMSSKVLYIATNSKTKELSLVDNRAGNLGECEDMILYNEMVDMIWRALSSLNDRYAMTMKLFYFDDYSEKEIAELLGTSVSAVEKIMYRAKKHMKEYFTENDYTPVGA